MLVVEQAQTTDRTDRRPMCIWDIHNNFLYYASSVDIQDAWNDYAQHEANVFNDRNASDKQTGLMYQWRPALSFKVWRERYVSR